MGELIKKPVVGAKPYYCVATSATTQGGNQLSNPIQGYATVQNIDNNNTQFNQFFAKYFFSYSTPGPTVTFNDKWTIGGWPTGNYNAPIIGLNCPGEDIRNVFLTYNYAIGELALNFTWHNTSAAILEIAILANFNNP